MMAENRIFHYWLPRPHSLEKCPEMRPHIVEVGAVEHDTFIHRRLTNLGVVLLMPFLFVRRTHGMREARSVVARGRVRAGLRRVAETKLRDFQQPFCSLETIGLRHV